jgi:hypothetical protein
VNGRELLQGIRITGPHALSTAISTATHRSFRALALWLGLAALIVQSLVPAYASLAASHDGTSIVICTAHGFQTVQVDGDGNALPGKSSANAQDCCTDCQATGGFVLPTPIRVPEPLRISYGTVAFRTSPSIAPRFFSAYVTRGPPLLSI